MPYPALSLIAICLFSLVHLLAEKTRQVETITHGRFLSFGGGVAIAYVFVDLLPKLCKNNLVVQKAFSGIIPYAERHVYVVALAGFLLFFFINKTHSLKLRNHTFWLSMSSYALFNFLVGYAVVDKDNPEVQPLALFTFAMALHYFTNDYTLCKMHGHAYEQKGRWFLIASLFLGWILGTLFELSETAIALLSAFIGGGMIMNVIGHELPSENPNSLGSFLASAAIYTFILLSIGQ